MGRIKRREKKKKRHPPRPVTYLNVCDVLLDFFFFKLVTRPCQYPVIDILAQSGCRGGGRSRD